MVYGMFIVVWIILKFVSIVLLTASWVRTTFLSDASVLSCYSGALPISKDK